MKQIKAATNSAMGNRRILAYLLVCLAAVLTSGSALAASPCDSATYPNQCGWLDGGTLPPFVRDAIVSKGGVLGVGNVLVLTSGDPNDPDTEISNDMMQFGCGTNPDGWETYDCNLVNNFVPAQDSVVLALSSEWFEWYQTFYTDWMTISAGGVPTVDVSINSWINNKVDIIPYGPVDTGVVILTSLSAAKMVSFRVADSGDHIYDTAILVVPATWFGAVSGASQDKTLLCGNGKLDPGEECDDDNFITDDGCSSICLGAQPTPVSTPVPSTCGNLVFSWPSGTTSPYTCGNDLCAGFRCVLGNTISPACYTADQCAAACSGTCVDVQAANLDCSVMCAVQPPANATPPPTPTTCADLVYAWPDGTTKAYTCDDACGGERCVIGTTISPTCYDPGLCDPVSCPGGTCVDILTTACVDICALGSQAASQPTSCGLGEEGSIRVAANQKGQCHGNMEVCTSGSWIPDGNFINPEDELCNGLDDDCNGIVDDMFVTCGDANAPLCQNTVNTCDPNNPAVPIVCNPLPPPSPFEICNDGLDNDCDGSADNGCQCGDNDCMAGEDFLNCAADCPPPVDDTPCEDGNLCTLGDSYQGGVCTSGTTINTCDDHNLCTTNEVCDPIGGCSATKVNCDDGNPCTLDSCDSAIGCLHAPDPACQVDADSDGFFSVATGGTDCDDNNPAVYPGANEVCNGVDDNCDTQIDEGFNVGSACQSAPNVCGDAGVGAMVCAVDGLSSVCDATTPAATDTDSDGTPDCLDLCPSDPAKSAPGVCGCGAPETVATYYADVDGDTFGSAANPTQACSAPAGYVSDSSDCDDGSASVHPGATEVFNGIDDNCNGQVDEYVAEVCPAVPAICGSAGKSKMSLKSGPDPSRRRFVWKWLKGTLPLSQADFGDPLLGNTGYTLCVYDQTGGVPALKMSATVPPGGTCGMDPCWRDLGGNGWAYKSKTPISDGLTKVTHKGGVADRPKVRVIGKGLGLPVPAPVSGSRFFAQDTAVIVQLHSSTSANCWASTFDPSSTKKNDGEQFRAVTP